MLLCSNRKTAQAIVEEKGLKQVSDSGAIEALIDQVLAANLEKLRSLEVKDKLFGFFVGQVMKQSGGQANPSMVNQTLRSKLDLIRGRAGGLLVVIRPIQWGLADNASTNMLKTRQLFEGRGSGNGHVMDG